MGHQPEVWHFGLMAERWGEVLTEAPELDFYKDAIERFGEPVLDLACGSGRLLLPLLRAGIEVDGADVSADMLQQCRRRMEQAGLETNLYQQPMNRLDLPRQYNTIYLCGSFGLAGSRKQDLETLQRCHAQLAPAGALILNIQAEYTDPDHWQLWSAVGRRRLPQPWPDDGRGKRAADGSEHRAYFRTIDHDPLQQTYTRQVRLEKWSDGELQESEERTLTGNMYLPCEVRLMLQGAGFSEIELVGDYSHEPATVDHDELVFTAVK